MWYYKCMRALLYMVVMVLLSGCCVLLPYPVYIEPPIQIQIQIKGDKTMFDDLFTIEEEPEVTANDEHWDTEQYWYSGSAPDVWNVNS